MNGADVAHPGRFIVHKLAFTGPGKPTKDLQFGGDVNVLWGASNAGKSFTVKAIDYMFGSSTTLPQIKERQGYDTCWLDLTLPISGRTTLARALTGGGYRIFQGAFEDAQNSAPVRTVAAAHAPKVESLSSFLLSELGVANRQIARNLNGEKGAFTIRHFASYMLTEETPMMAEWSPIKIAAQSGDTFDKNVLKFILTGSDDAAVVPTKSAADQRLANAGKMEIVDEMISAATEDLKRLFPDDEDVHVADLQTQDDVLSATIEDLQSTLRARQSEMDELRRERRDTIGTHDVLETRANEIAMTLERFKLLADVYDSDVERLESLYEGAAALLAGEKRACPLCGADPEHQHEVHGLDHIRSSQQAVQAEIAKIRLERADLVRTVTSLEMEQRAIVARIDTLSEAIEDLERETEELRPQETTSRMAYEEADRVRRRLREGISLKARIESLGLRKAALEAFKPASTPRDSITVGVSGAVGHELALTIQGILRAWQFPGDPVVSFDGKTHDILLDGTDRRSNGKGVRALMNSAFKLGVLTYCRAKGLPHPGIVVLDSPLLSYRDPHTSKYGELSADEEAVKRTGLNVHFYQYLLDHAGDRQFIIVENDEPPFDLGPDAQVTRFVGASGSGGRQGLL